MNVYVCIPTKTHHIFGEGFGFAWKSGLGKQVASQSRSQWPVKFSSQVPVMCGNPISVHKPTGDLTHKKEDKIFNLKLFWTEKESIPFPIPVKAVSVYLEELK